MKRNSSTYIRVICSLSLVITQGAFAIPETGTGSYGMFSPKAFLEAVNPWTVYRMTGEYSKSGFPCDSMGVSCRRDKSYTISSLKSMKRRGGINVGTGIPMGSIVRHDAGSASQIEIKAPNNLVLARLDGTRASSRLGADAAATMTASRSNGLYGGNTQLGHMESKDAAWARLNPHSFYYQVQDQTHFGLTVVEKLHAAGLVQNYLKNTPMAQRFREGTYWCLSDSWRPSESLESLIKNDEFDMAQCDGKPLLSSKTVVDIPNVTSGLFLNRQDSKITVFQPTQNNYGVKVSTNWFCPFDCDGSTYSIHLNDGRRKVFIASDKFNWLSSTQFKVKVIYLDDGSSKLPEANKVDLVEITSNPSIYNRIAAVIITEITNGKMDNKDNGVWTQNTFVMLPPTSQSVTQQIDLVDGLLAMMPDQVQSSPELRDAEEKIDEIRLFTSLQNSSLSSVNADLIFDILSPYDATTAVSWKSPIREDVIQGKVAQALEKLSK